ncbi:hypothetical protein SAMN05216326_11945 [Nitrosomonas marina]|uniref:Uncharacterized protein n=1 Tax=Nitrosomonas marina TaxID=917 RepID=A0A1I0DC63_9PROT|nr:hypothetical protein [Nitrosomonas marina]SET29917.1 hypothetical protein SAMN05216326_11945 [Nitrosomonas marina]
MNKTCPLVDEARIQIDQDMTVRLDALFQEQENAFETRMAPSKEKKHALTRQHKAERQKLREAQHLHWQHKQQEWRNNLKKGFCGLFDRVTGNVVE